MRWLPKGHPDRRDRTRSELAVGGALVVLAVALPILVAFEVLAGAAAKWLGAVAFVAGASFVVAKVRGHRNKEQSAPRRLMLAAVGLILAGVVAYFLLAGETGV